MKIWSWSALLEACQKVIAVKNGPKGRVCGVVCGVRCGVRCGVVCGVQCGVRCGVRFGVRFGVRCGVGIGAFAMSIEYRNIVAEVMKYYCLW